MSVLETRVRTKTGVPGLDPLIQGGLQQGDFVLLVGGIGTGKTIFSCQFAYNAAKLYGEKTVFATFEEDIASLKRNMMQFGMDLGSLERDGNVKLIDLEALEGGGMGANIETLLGALDEIKGKRLVVDSLTAFLSGAAEKFDYSFLMHLVYKTLKREGITTLMTVSAPQGSSGLGAGVEEFVADGLFQLESYITENMELKTRFIVRKLRGTDHSRKYHNVAFTPSGIEIYKW
ncbi:MAG: AAA family ATPase [Thaumarchaeota archaeon]|nr:AAA family ATPase [Nitrososphaerota archaeon]